MSDAYLRPSVDLSPPPASRHASQAADTGFVTPWAHDVPVVVDLRRDEPVSRVGDAVFGIPRREWLLQLADVRAEISELKQEIRRLREGLSAS